jgi:hypothetical protein
MDADQGCHAHVSTPAHSGLMQLFGDVDQKELFCQFLQARKRGDLPQVFSRFTKKLHEPKVCGR